MMPDGHKELIPNGHVVLMNWQQGTDELAAGN